MSTVDGRTLTGHELSGLHDAVLHAYPARHGLERLLFFRLDKDLSVLTGDGGMDIVVLQVLRIARAQGWLARFVDEVLADRPHNPRLLQWAAACRWGTARMPAPEPLPTPDQQLLDTTFFDLNPVRAGIRAARDAAGANVLALGLHDADPVVITKVCTWLPHCLGEVERKEWLDLRPVMGTPDARVKQVVRYIADLESVNVVCPILTSGAPITVIAEFWHGLRPHLGVHPNWFVAIFTGAIDDDEGYPSDIVRLAAPVAPPHELDEWTEQMVSRIGWPPALAPAWTRLIMSECWDGTRIDMRTMFEVMDRSIRDVRLRRPEFHRRLKELSGADPSPR